MSWRRFPQSALGSRSHRGAALVPRIETEENIGRGISPESARRAAHLKLGNTVRIREEIYRLNTIGRSRMFGRDLRLALRGMRRRPGSRWRSSHTRARHRANTAIFGVVDGVLIKPLSYPNAGELVSIKQVAPGLNVSELRMSGTQDFTYRDEGRVFSTSVCTVRRDTITGIGEPEQARLLAVTYDVLQAWASSRSWAGSSERPTRHPARPAEARSGGDPDARLLAAPVAATAG